MMKRARPVLLATVTLMSALIAGVILVILISDAEIATSIDRDSDDTRYRLYISLWTSEVSNPEQTATTNSSIPSAKSEPTLPLRTIDFIPSKRTKKGLIIGNPMHSDQCRNALLDRHNLEIIDLLSSHLPSIYGD